MIHPPLERRDTFEPGLFFGESMTHSHLDIRFRPVVVGDYAMLGEWLREPHVRQWWGDPEYELGLIRDMVEGRDSSRPFIFELAGEPLGYIQYWFIGEHQSEPWVSTDPWLAELPADAVGVDLSIGCADRLSQGIGTAVLQAFVARLLVDGFETIIIDPDPNNARAVRAYEKAGFSPIAELAGRTGDVLIMQWYGPGTERTL